MGRLEYTSGSKLEISDWVNKCWVPLTRMALRINLLMNRWIMFIFPEAFDIDQILLKFWVFKQGSLFLKRWHVNFDPLKESQGIRHLWMLIPGLPIELWSEELIMGLANAVGKFIRFDKHNRCGMDRRVAKVMVEMDMRPGLPAEVEVVWGSRVWRQRLDFYKIPFRCFACRKIGHVQANCSSFRHHRADSSSSGLSTPKSSQSKSLSLIPGKSIPNQSDLFSELSKDEILFIEKSEKDLSKRIFKGEVILRHDLVTGLLVDKVGQVPDGSLVGRSLIKELNSMDLIESLPTNPHLEEGVFPNNPILIPSEDSKEVPSVPAGSVLAESILNVSSIPLSLKDKSILNESGYLLSEKGLEFPPLSIYSKNPGLQSDAIPLHSLNFQNVTIRRGKKKKFLPVPDNPDFDSYTLVSKRLEDEGFASSSIPEGLRAASPSAAVP